MVLLAHPPFFSCHTNLSRYDIWFCSCFSHPASARSESRFCTGFGTAHHNSNVYISQDHEKVNYGRIGPGPANYNTTNIWQQAGAIPDSTKTSAACTKLGKSERFYSVKDPKLPNGTPGPGSYVY
jgi:hypothetical protein